MILVTADVLGRYLNIPPETGLRALESNRKRKSVAIENLIKIAEFVLKIILNLTEKLSKKCQVLK